MDYNTEIKPTKMSIKSNELRLGNYLLLNNTLHRPKQVGKFVVVKAITDATATISIVGDEFEDTFAQFIKYLEPIPLDSTVLLKCGAELLVQTDDVYVLKIDNTLELSIDLTNECYYIGRGADNIAIDKPIKYLHTLQNFYYLLSSGKELNIQLT